MVQKATTSTKTRGRPPKFDRDAVIDAAIGAFWENGLEATSLPELEAATGVDRSTLYNSFGGKQGLYELATSRYLDHAETSLFSPLVDGTTDGLGDIVVFLERLKSGLTSATAQPGCLIVNDMATGANAKPAERYQRMLETGLFAALNRAGASTAATAKHRAGLISSAVIGINLMSSTGRSAAEIGTLVDSAIAEVRNWQAESASALDSDIA